MKFSSVPLFLLLRHLGVIETATATTDCVDSTLPAILDFAIDALTCSDISNFGLSQSLLSQVCTSQQLTFHCPVLCEACLSGCYDSEAIFEVNGGLSTCIEVSQNTSSCDVPGVRQTCKETCEYCNIPVNVTELALIVSDLSANIVVLEAENEEFRAQLNMTENRILALEQLLFTDAPSVSDAPSIPRNWSQLGSSINGEDADDRLGWAVSLSNNGQTVAIGAYYGEYVSIYSYGEQDLGWTQVGNNIYGEASGDYFGFSVSLSDDGKTVAIGGYINDGNGIDSGHVRVYQYNDELNIWSQLGNDIDGESANDDSGYSVSISDDGNTVVIGARFNGGCYRGHARIFTYNGSSWSQLGDDIDGEADGDNFGTSVAMARNGDIVAIGGPYNDGNGSESGHVRVYSLNRVTSSWEQIGADIDGEAIYDTSGTAVALSKNGDIVAIGASGNDVNGVDSGHTRVYSYNDDTSVWMQMGDDIDGTNPYDYAGYHGAVSLSDNGNILAVGAPYNDDNGSTSGSVTVYEYDGIGADWSQIGNVIYGESANDQSSSVSLSGDGFTIAIGGRYNDDGGSNSGHVRIFKYGIE